ncbi:cAMP-dependent protein kinase type II-beta regulatory subunit [Cichlidogyrus casuarinus]|uniref:cAMP-dependent protein kinase type II regulatory subunit n=1 Tax=Cichlidogyrus casuarinus TaxID=1844966 RepID=A0ABD2PVT8_9PLAT
MPRDEIAVPDGLRELLQEFTVSVLRNKPDNLVNFGYDFFKMKKTETESKVPAVSSGPYSDEEEEEMAPPIPRNYRRTGVAAESFDPEKQEETPKVVHPKTDDQKARLLKATKDILLFRCLDDDQMIDVIDAMFERKVQEGDKVITYGEDGDNFYVIERGSYDIIVKVDGEMKVVGKYEDKGSFGELALMYNTPRAATIEAKTEGVVWAMTRETFRGIVLRKAFEKRQLYERLLNQVPLLSTLSGYERMNIFDALKTKIFEPGEVIIRQGESGTEMYFIEDGEVHIKRKGDDGKEVDLTVLKVGGYFGELALITKQPRAASAYAHKRTKLAVLDVSSFERLLGPCNDILQRNIDVYNKQLEELFGSNVPELRK